MQEDVQTLRTGYCHFFLLGTHANRPEMSIFNSSLSFLPSIFAHRRPEKGKQSEGEERNSWAMVSRMRASTETGDRQRLEQRCAEGKILKKNLHCLFYIVFVCRYEIQPHPLQALGVFRVPRGCLSTFKHSQQGDHALNPSLQKSAPVSLYNLKFYLIKGMRRHS